MAKDFRQIFGSGMMNHINCEFNGDVAAERAATANVGDSRLFVSRLMQRTITW